MRSVGVDGYPRGWVAVALVDGRFESAKLFPEFKDVLAANPDPAAIGVDIPIGLPDRGLVRAADVAAQRFVGPRRASVFLTPPRAAVEAANYDEARAHASFSRQAFALSGKIRDVDALVGPNDRVYEVHPEVSLRALAGRSLAFAKTSWNGLALRRRLLASAAILLPDELGPAGLAGPNDVLDAAVAAWSADRIARGLAGTLPERPETDYRGRLVAIWY